MVELGASCINIPKKLLYCVLVLLAACSYKGGSEQPVVRKFTWFSYLAGNDIKGRCDRELGQRYRFVYNGIYTEQVRSYDIVPTTKGRYEIKIRVNEEADLSAVSINLEDPDMFKPWRPTLSSSNVSENEIDILRKTLVDIGFFDSPPPSVNLSSIDFYWIVSACVDGKFSQNAYLWPHKIFKTAQFPKLLSLWDFTDIPINQPRKTTTFSIYGTDNIDDHRNYFSLNFGDNGLLTHSILE